MQYGPFVMNSREEIEQAMADYRANRRVRSNSFGFPLEESGLNPYY